MTTDLEAAAEAAQAATAAYIADPTDRDTGRQWDRACAEFSLACTEDAILALYAEIEKITRHSEALAFDLDRAVMERDEARSWQEPVNLREEISAFAGRCAVAMWDPSPADIERARRQMEDDMLAVAMHLAGPYRARAEAAEAALSAAQEEVGRLLSAMDREEAYLHRMIDASEENGGIMHGDLEGAFHRIRDKDSDDAERAEALTKETPHGDGN